MWLGRGEAEESDKHGVGRGWPPGSGRCGQQQSVKAEVRPGPGNCPDGATDRAKAPSSLV